jgi:hypothetical protein
MNFREVETVGPLAAKVMRHNQKKKTKNYHHHMVVVDDSYTDETLYNLAHTLKHRITRGELCNELIVIVWKHSRIADLAHILGCGPQQGCPLDYSGKTFDQIWQIRYIYTTLWMHSTRKHHFLSSSATAIPSHWTMFGSVQNENFDPLAFSYLYHRPYHHDEEEEVEGQEHPDRRRRNDHNLDTTGHDEEGTTTTRYWEDQVVAYPERQHAHDTAGWKMTMVSFPKPTTP